VGLLGAVGLRITWAEVKDALWRCRIGHILAANFVAVPAMAAGAAILFGLKQELALAMIILAAAPFAPVVPVFARMARADIALAAGLTAVFPLMSVVLTPVAAQAAMQAVTKTDALRFNMLSSLVLLIATITLPLVAGVMIRHKAPETGRKLMRPVEVLSEATGAASLAFVVISEFGSILKLGWRAWLAMALVFELSLLLGWALGGRDRGSRQVIALGTSNRNIALAILVAIQNFPGTGVVPGVAGNGLLLILLGLAHVGAWRFAGRRRGRHELGN
jgi:BASS family bile acid:Na+ symporter